MSDLEGLQRLADKKRFFELTDDSGRPTGTVYKSRTPYKAAEKAANAGVEDIYLYEDKIRRLYSYHGSTYQVDPSTLTENARRHMEKYGMTKRAKVTSMGFKNI